jgi:hypothetical protein
VPSRRTRSIGRRFHYPRNLKMGTGCVCVWPVSTKILLMVLTLLALLISLTLLAS